MNCLANNYALLNKGLVIRLSIVNSAAKLACLVLYAVTGGVEPFGITRGQ